MVETNQLASIDEDEKLPLGPFVRDYSVDSLFFWCSFVLVHTLWFACYAYIGVVHSDISINNVMFSKLSNIWKLIDFEYALPIEVSLNNFAEMSAQMVLSLSWIRVHWNLRRNRMFIHWEQPFDTHSKRTCGKIWEKEKGHKNALILFKSLVNGMCETDPNQKRLSVIDALSTLIRYWIV